MGITQKSEVRRGLESGSNCVRSGCETTGRRIDATSLARYIAIRSVKNLAEDLIRLSKVAGYHCVAEISFANPVSKRFDAAKEKGTQGKREFFYNVFLLDPDVAKKVAKLGLKQVYAEVRLLDEDTDERRSTTEACQRLQDEDMTAEQFEHVENALRVAPEAKQFMLGAKGGKSAKTAGALPDKEEEEPEKAENAYKKYYDSQGV